MFAANAPKPLNRYPLWRYILIVVLIALAVIYALPNVFGESPAVQVSPKGGKKISTTLLPRVEQVLKKDHLAYTAVQATPYNLEFRFKDTTVQMQAKDAIKVALGSDYVVALNLAANTPKYLSSLGANPMKYGLDLRGGMYFLLDIDMQTVIGHNLDNYLNTLKSTLRQDNIRYRNVQVKKNSIHIQLRSKENFEQAEALVHSKAELQGLLVDENQSQNNNLVLNLDPKAVNDAKQYAVSQVIQVMRNRVNELGVAEASVTRQGADRVVVELPGVQDAARAKEILGGTASLNVMLVNEDANVMQAVNGQVPLGSSLYYDQNGRPYVLYNKIILTGKSFVGASSGYDGQSGFPVVNVKLTGPEVSYFSKVTRENVGHLLAIVLIQPTFEMKKINGKLESITHNKNTIISAATIQSALGNNFQITGSRSAREAQNLALTIRAGALPAPVRIVEERQIGPSLGLENIKMGEEAVVLAMLLVVIFMMIYYRLMGFIAVVALGLNLIFIVAVMSIMPGATLTLPGIAGIVLNLGMAIDGNVLIFERIREELRQGISVQAAISAGYDRAFATIVDSNVTTLIVAIILYAIGTGAVKGFAVTLMIGIVTSMFTAITVTRAMVNAIYGGRRLKRISIGI